MSAAVHYTVTPSDPHAHQFTVDLVVTDPDPAGQRLTLPAWIPGSYLIREFAKNIIRIAAFDDHGDVPLTKLGKDTWAAAPARGALRVRIVVYAWDLSVRMAHLDQNHGYFNGTSLFLRVHGKEGEPHSVTVQPGAAPAVQDWTVHTTLPRTSGGDHAYGDFLAADYDEVLDHPFEMGTPQVVSFEACGVPHEMVFTGRVDADLDRIARDVKVICETILEFWGGPAPMERYLFQTMVVGKGYGGLEHRASTSLICQREDLPRVGDDRISPGYRQFLGLCSHEYFHTWNVKRIKPARFTPYDLNTEGHTTLLWAFEGITSYYDDLMLLRSGAIPESDYLELLGKSATRVFRSPGRHLQSLADSSFDAWTKFYRQDENAINAIVSYYTKGALVALALDLRIRRDTGGRHSLDDVMRTLWERHGKTGVGVPEDGIETVAGEVSGLDLTEFFDQAIRGTDDLPFSSLLEDFGVRFGRRGSEKNGDPGGTPPKHKGPTRGWLGADGAAVPGGTKLIRTFAGGPAQQAGLSAGDVIIAVDGIRATGSAVDDLGKRVPGTQAEVHAFRRDELMRFTVTLGDAPLDRVWLEPLEDAAPEAVARREAWLRSASGTARAAEADGSTTEDAKRGAWLR